MPGQRNSYDLLANIFLFISDLKTIVLSKDVTDLEFSYLTKVLSRARARARFDCVPHITNSVQHNKGQIDGFLVVINL